MEIKIYANDKTTEKLKVAAVLSSSLHQSLNGECTFNLSMPGTRLPGVDLGDELRLGNLYFDITRISRASQTAGAMFSLSCEHISYVLADANMSEGEITGTPAAGLAAILSGTGLSAGTVDVSGTFSMTVKEGMSRRDALQKWASKCGAEISYTARQINLLGHVGSRVAVNLSEAENVKSLTVNLDSRSTAASYSVELSRLQRLGIGDELMISYSSLEIWRLTRILSLDYDPFHPMSVRMECGLLLPTYYEQNSLDMSSLKEEVEDLDERKIEISDASEILIDQLSTSRRIRKYILQDTSDDNFIKIQDQYIKWVTGTIISSTGILTEDGLNLLTESGIPLTEEVGSAATEQATNRYGQGLYWQKEPVGHTSDGYPTDADGVQIYATTNPTNWPVLVYKYTELVKSEYAFDMVGQNYIPQVVLGAGDENGNSKGYIYKDEMGFYLRYKSSEAKNVDIRFSDDGFVDAMHRRLSYIDIDTENGEVYYGLEGSNSLYRLSFTQTESSATFTWPDGFQCEVSVV